MDPKSKNDFDILFSSLEAWRKKAIAYCYSTKSGEPIRITLCPRWKSVSSHCMIYAFFLLWQVQECLQGVARYRFAGLPPDIWLLPR